jgi:hypothetical protein
MLIVAVEPPPPPPPPVAGAELVVVLDVVELLELELEHAAATSITARMSKAVRRNRFMFLSSRGATVA